MKYHELLSEAFDQQRAENPMLSLRAFSQALNLDPSFTCRLLKKKIRITPARARSIVKGLVLTPEKEKEFLQSVYQEDFQLRLRKVIEESQQTGLDPETIQRLVHELCLERA